MVPPLAYGAFAFVLGEATGFYAYFFLDLSKLGWTNFLGTNPDALERAVTDHPYLAGDSFSAADVATGSQIGFGMHFGTIEKRPALEAYWARISARPALGRASAADDAARSEKE